MPQPVMIGSSGLPSLFPSPLMSLYLIPDMNGTGPFPAALWFAQPTPTNFPSQNFTWIGPEAISSPIVWPPVSRPTVHGLFPGSVLFPQPPHCKFEYADRSSLTMGAQYA